MDPLALEKPFLDGGIRTVSFFNGRLLTAEDLSREQEARRLADWRLGRAIGEGVAYGLEVLKHSEATAQEPLVTVKPGLAINRAGQTLCLTEDTTVALVRKSKLAAPADTTFAQCGPLEGGTYVAGPGVYLLTIAPAAAREGKALTSGLELGGGRCNTDAMVETVQFRLLSLELTAFGLTSPVAQPKEESLFRNRLAALCLGTKSPDHSDPFAGSGADPVSELAGKALSNCDVPLALLYWTLSGGVRFIDQWAVRRRLAQLGVFSSGAIWLRPRVTALGEARLLQFTAHLEDLLRPELRTDEQRLEEFFRYVPPAACFPFSGAGSSRGFRVSRFLASVTHGGPDRMTAGMAAGVLDRSFAFASVDLNEKPCLQTYEIEENARAVSAGSSKQRYLLYVVRTLNGPASRDSVTGAFEDAWVVYRGLARKRVFIPLGSTQEETAARMEVVGVFRDVMEVANRQAARAAAWSLDTGDALKAYGLLYTVQQDLNELLGSEIPGVDGSQEREVFASVIDQYLNQNIPGPKPSLKNALNAGSLCEVVEAQEAINRFVGTWSGEGVAIGPFGFSFSRSDGTLLVPGAAPIAQFFTLSNGTDRTLTMTFAAEATAATGNWLESTRILDSKDGKEIDRATLASGASREIVVMVGAPGSARVGEPVTLTLTAEAGPPTSRTSTYTNAALLKVSESLGGQVEGQVEITQHRFIPPNLDPADIAPNSIFGLRVSVTYASGDATPRGFDLDLSVDPGNARIWTFRDEDTGTPLPASEAGDRYTLRLSAVPADGSPTVGRIRIQAPQRSATADRSVTLRLSIRSVDLDPAISFEYAESITLVVKSST